MEKAQPTRLLMAAVLALVLFLLTLSAVQVGSSAASAPAAASAVFTPTHYQYLPLVLRGGSAVSGVVLRDVNTYTVGAATYIVGVVINGLDEPVEDLVVLADLRRPDGAVDRVTAWVPTDHLRPPSGWEMSGDRTCFRVASYDPVAAYTLAVTYALSSDVYPLLYTTSVVTDTQFGWPVATATVHNASGSAAAGTSVAVWGYEAPDRVGSCDAAGGTQDIPPGGTAQFTLFLSRNYAPVSVHAHPFVVQP